MAVRYRRRRTQGRRGPGLRAFSPGLALARMRGDLQHSVLPFHADAGNAGHLPQRFELISRYRTANDAQTPVGSASQRPASTSARSTVSRSAFARSTTTVTANGSWLDDSDIQPLANVLADALYRPVEVGVRAGGVFGFVAVLDALQVFGQRLAARLGMRRLGLRLPRLLSTAQRDPQGLVGLWRP